MLARSDHVEMCQLLGVTREPLSEKLVECFFAHLVYVQGALPVPLDSPKQILTLIHGAFREGWIPGEIAQPKPRGDLREPGSTLMRVTSGSFFGPMFGFSCRSPIRERTRQVFPNVQIPNVMPSNVLLENASRCFCLRQADSLIDHPDYILKLSSEWSGSGALGRW